MAEVDETTLATRSLEADDQRAVYTDWLLERGDPRGGLLSAARSLEQATGAAAGRAAARLEIVAALKRVAAWLDTRVPEGAPWRSADTRGVTSDRLGFVSHDRGLLRRLRVVTTHARPIPTSVFEALPTLKELAVPEALSVVSLGSLERVRCLDLELPGTVRQSQVERFDGLGAALAEGTELRLSDGALETTAFARLLATCGRASLVWLDRVRLLEDLLEAPTVIAPASHLRLVETALGPRVVAQLVSAGVFAGLNRLEIKEWLPSGQLEPMVRAATHLEHLALLRCPLGIEVVDVLVSTGRLAQLETLDASGCLLALGGVAKLLREVGPRMRRLTLRFNQLTATDLGSLARLSRWPSCEVKLEEVTFGAAAHDALAQLASAHRLRLEVAGCVVTLKASSANEEPGGHA